MSGENLNDNMQEEISRVIIEYTIDSLLARIEENEECESGKTISYDTALKELKDNKSNPNQKWKIYRKVVFTNEEIQEIISYVKEGIKGVEHDRITEGGNWSDQVIAGMLWRLVVKKCLDNGISVDILYEEGGARDKEGDKGKRNPVLDEISRIKDLFYFFSNANYYSMDKSRKYEFVFTKNDGVKVYDMNWPKGMGRTEPGKLCCEITVEGNVIYKRKPKWLELGKSDVMKMVEAVCSHEVGKTTTNETETDKVLC